MPSTLTTFSTKSDPSPLPPIILIPGLGSSQLVSVPKTSCFEAMHLVWLNLPQLVKTLASSTLAECWISSLSLSPYDGDPRGFKTRPVHSLSSVSTLSPPGTLSNLVLANTNKVYADLISFLTTSLLYDPNVNLIGCAFDWRVSCRRMQERDDTFERLRKNLERAVKREGRPAVVITHSLGGIVFRAFLQYVEAEMEGKEEFDSWLSQNVETLVMLSPPLLGAVSPARAVISGEPMGLPLAEADAWRMEVTFGSSLTALPLPFPDVPKREGSSVYERLTRFNGQEPLITVTNNTGYHFSSGSTGGGVLAEFHACNITTGEVFEYFAKSFPEVGSSPLTHKRDHIKHAFRPPYDTLSSPWARPAVANVIIAYGYDVGTEVGFNYRGGGGRPEVDEVVWEDKGGRLWAEQKRAKLKGLLAKGPLKKGLGETGLGRGGDGTIPYWSLSRGHVWAAEEGGQVDELWRRGEGEWKVVEDGNEEGKCEAGDDESGICAVFEGAGGGGDMSRVGGLVYKYVSEGREGDRRTVIIEAEGVEHKEAVRSEEVLRAVFEEVFGREDTKRETD